MSDGFEYISRAGLEHRARRMRVGFRRPGAPAATAIAIAVVALIAAVFPVAVSAYDAREVFRKRAVVL
jgi:hypothetical protein